MILTLARRALYAATTLSLFAPLAASAHEVYVLTPAEIASSMTTASVPPLDTMMADLHLFIFWAFIAIFTVAGTFLISISRQFESVCDPALMTIKRYAPFVSRVTIGLSFLASALFGATYGPELPILATFGTFSPVVTTTLVIMGVLITIGLWARAAAVLALVLYAVATYFHGSYMLTYINYLGEILVLLIIGSHGLSVDRLLGKPGKRPKQMHALVRTFAPFSFLILRVCFGISLIYASYYAKFLHSDLAYQVVTLPLAGHALGLATYMHFAPSFLVLGAGIIEIVLGVFFILGLEIRFASAFVCFWIAMSLWYFGETVWPHLILFGIPVAFFLYGYDKYSLEGLLFKKGTREPVF